MLLDHKIDTSIIHNLILEHISQNALFISSRDFPELGTIWIQKGVVLETNLFQVGVIGYIKIPTDLAQEKGLKKD